MATMASDSDITRTPWGVPQSINVLADGITSVSTAGHGGIKLNRKRNAQVPDYMRRTGGWYEEDCEWAIPFVVFEADLLVSAVLRSDSWTLSAINGREHFQCLRSWNPDAYERFTGIQINPGESYIRDEQLFHTEHAADLIVTCAWGDWNPKVPAGMVGVLATIGGSRTPGTKERYFLVPSAEYDQRGRFGFVIDPAKHTEVFGSF